MNRYECRQCDSEMPCILEHDAVVEPPDCCPYNRETAPSWVEITKPEPQPAEGEIMQGAYEIWPRNDTPFQMNLHALARLIQAGIDKNEQGIEAVRETVKGNEQVTEGNFDAIASELRDCVKHDPDMLEQVTNWRKEIERKVEELEAGHIQLDASYKTHFEVFHTSTRKPQTKGGVAYAWDKDHTTKHDLTPGVSVYTTGHGNCERIFHHQEKNLTRGYQVSGSEICTDYLTPDDTRKVYWLRNLDFPQDSGSSKGGE